MDNSPKLKIYLLCLSCRLPKYLAFIIIDYCYSDEKFKYSYEVASRGCEKNYSFIFEKACEVDNVNLVKLFQVRFWVDISIEKGFISACMRNNLKTINFLKELIIKKKFIKASAYAGFFKTAWMLSKKLKHYRPVLLRYIMLSSSTFLFNSSLQYNEKSIKERDVIIKKCLKKKISFDCALYYAIREDDEIVVEEIVNLGVPCDAGLRLAFMKKNISLIEILSKNVVNKLAFLKKLIKSNIKGLDWSAFSFCEKTEENKSKIKEKKKTSFIENYGMVLAAKYGNIEAYRYFVLSGGTAFNEAISKSCKYEKKINHKEEYFCSYCENKNI
jgi:hypothetical protein